MLWPLGSLDSVQGATLVIFISGAGGGENIINMMVMMVMVELYMFYKFYMFTMVHITSMFRVEP